MNPGGAGNPAGGTDAPGSAATAITVRAMEPHDLARVWEMIRGLAEDHRAQLLR